MEAFSAFDADVQRLPQWVPIWMNIIAVVLVTSTVALLIGRQTRVLGLYLLAITCGVALVFDYYDVARWIFGQRQPVV